MPADGLRLNSGTRPSRISRRQRASSRTTSTSVGATAVHSRGDVDLFIAGDGVAVLRPETLDAGNGIGAGSLREHVDALVAGGARFYASGMSSKARGLTVESFQRMAVIMAPPSRLVELAFEADRVISY